MPVQKEDGDAKAEGKVVITSETTETYTEGSSKDCKKVETGSASIQEATGFSKKEVSIQILMKAFFMALDDCPMTSY